MQKNNKTNRWEARPGRDTPVYSSTVTDKLSEVLFVNHLARNIIIFIFPN